MSSTKRSNLPAVLQQYIPTYEQKTPVKKDKPKKGTTAPTQESRRSQKTSESENNGNKPDVAPRTSESSGAGRTGGDKNERTRHGRTKSPQRPLTSRERSTLQDEAKTKQQALKTYGQWQNLQRQLKEEDTDLLKRKIQLQLTLIRQQQALAEYNRQLEEEERKKKRDAERKEKREIAEALLRTCKESLECDRRARAQKHKVTPRRKDDNNSIKPSTADGRSRSKSRSRSQDRAEQESEDEMSIATAASPTKMRVQYEGMVAKEPTGLEDTPASTKPASPVTRDVTLVRDYAREYTGVSTLAEMEEEAEDNEERQEEDEPDQYADLPWHHVQLYKLYGRANADAFLYPKIETEKKRSNKPLDPKYQAEGGGRLSANELWAILRGESQGKLLREDASIPLELKDAYGCFVRESVSKRKPAVKRNFNRPDKQEEADMEKMQDHSRLVGAQNSRHQLEIMYRSSHMNEDRARVLQYNNPIPDLNNIEGEESVARYMPSWMDDAEDEESVLSYTKWIAGTEAHEAGKSLGTLSLTDQSLSARKKRLPAITESGQNSKEPLETAEQSAPTAPETTTYGQGEWDFMLDNQRTNRGDGDSQPKYIFLTEKKARTPGQFSKRRREMLEAKNKPKGYEMAAPPQPLQDKANSAMGMLESNGSFIESSSLSLGSGSAQRTQSAYAQPPVTLWPPLSMNALQEYKPDKQGPGEGVLKQGRVPVWGTQTTQVAAN